VGHGDLDGRGAVRHSCNVYFYDLGQAVGAATLGDWYRLLGFGSPTGVGLREESGGRLPRPRTARTLRPMEAVYMAIGQGPFTATPMQGANAYATLARGGVSWTPTLYRDGPFEAQRERVDLGLDPRAVAVALQGMDDVVHHPRGTARALEVAGGQREPLWNTAGLDVIGKSGTAQTSPQLEAFDDDEDGYVDRWGGVLREGNNGWFVTLVKGEGEADWRYVVVVAIEHGGGGGMTAAPINNQVHHALQRHGYLPGAADD
jgi:penicillin-binding protein 2